MDRFIYRTDNFEENDGFQKKDAMNKKTLSSALSMLHIEEKAANDGGEAHADGAESKDIIVDEKQKEQSQSNKKGE